MAPETQNRNAAMMTSDIKIPWQLASPEDALQTHEGDTMCGGVTNKTTRGKRLPPITPWEIWWKWIQAKAVSFTRPDGNSK